MNLAKKIAQKLGGKNERAPTPEEAIQKSRETEVMLQKKQKYYESLVEEQLAVARKYAKTNERVAKQALKKKHIYQEKLKRLEGTLTTLEVQRQSIEDTTETIAVAEALSYGARAMKNTLRKNDPDMIHNLLDDLSGHHEMAVEGATLFANPIYGQNIDEDALELELQDLILEENFTVPSAVSLLPPVPDSRLTDNDPVRPSKAKEEDHDEDLKTLEAWAT